MVQLLAFMYVSNVETKAAVNKTQSKSSSEYNLLASVRAYSLATAKKLLHCQGC